MADDFARMGLSDEQIETMGWSVQRGPRVIGVLRRNRRIVETYLACTWELVMVPTKAAIHHVYRGIAAREITAAMDGVGVPPAQRQRVFAGVRRMAAIAQPLLNDHG